MDVDKFGVVLNENDLRRAILVYILDNKLELKNHVLKDMWLSQNISKDGLSKAIPIDDNISIFVNLDDPKKVKEMNVSGDMEKK